MTYRATALEQARRRSGSTATRSTSRPRKAGAKGTVHVETILSGEQAQELAGEGVTLTPKEIDGQTVTQRATAQAAAGSNVFQQVLAAPAASRRSTSRSPAGIR